jgi:drug/metabolite transporter (DMT)-like permease
LNSKAAKGFVSIFLAAFFFGFLAFLVKVASATLPASEILFVRSVVSLILIFAILFFSGKPYRVKNKKSLFLRGLFGGLAVFLYFLAISRINLSSAALIVNTYPLFAMLFSAILIKERAGIDSIIILLISFSGLFLVLGPNFEQLDIGYFMAMASAVLGGMAITMVRVLRRTDSTYVIISAQMIASGIICIPLTILNFKLPSLSGWGLLMLISVVGLAAQYFLTRPFKYIKASEGSIVALAASAFAIMFAILFLNEKFTIHFLIGAGLVFSGGLYLIAREEGWIPFIK